MLEIEKQIANWRQAMAKHFRGCDGVLEELEDHLRDTMHHLTQAGQSPQCAWQAALARLGMPSELAAEFAKIPPALEPWLPVRLVTVVGVVLSGWIMIPLLPQIIARKSETLPALHRGVIMLGYAATLLVGFLAVCFLLTRPFRELKAGQVQLLRRAVLVLSGTAVLLTGMGILLGSICPFCPYKEIAQYWSWKAHEVGGMAILAWDVVTLLFCCLHRRADRFEAVMLMGVIGNAVVILGWFGAVIVEKHALSSPRCIAIIIVLILSQFAIGCVSLAPAGCLQGKRA